MGDKESLAQDYADKRADDAWCRQQAKREEQDYGEHVDEEEEIACACCCTLMSPGYAIGYDGQNLCMTCCWSDASEILGAEVDREGRSPVDLSARWEAYEVLLEMLGELRRRMLIEDRRTM